MQYVRVGRNRSQTAEAYKGAPGLKENNPILTPFYIWHVSVLSSHWWLCLHTMKPKIGSVRYDRGWMPAKSTTKLLPRVPAAALQLCSHLALNNAIGLIAADSPTPVLDGVRPSEMKYIVFVKLSRVQKRRTHSL